MKDFFGFQAWDFGFISQDAARRTNLYLSIRALTERKKIVIKASVFTGGFINSEFKGW